jgi:hypothetical protein
VTANVAGFKFGGAAASATSAAAADDAAAEALITAQIDGEVAQHLRHLSKRDPVTKLKALQALRALIPQRQAAALAPALPPWIYVYKKLIMDLSRTVRAEASQVGLGSAWACWSQRAGKVGPCRRAAPPTAAAGWRPGADGR